MSQKGNPESKEVKEIPVGPEVKTDSPFLSKTTDQEVEIPAQDEMSLRRSERIRILTEKAQQNLEDETERRIKRFYTFYDRWQHDARRTRENLRTYQQLNELNELHRDLRKSCDTLIDLYDELKTAGPPPPEIVSKMDSCVSVSEDLFDSLQRRRLENEHEFEQQFERRLARDLKMAHQSVFGDYASNISSAKTCSSVNRIQADLDRATKLEEKRALIEEQSQKAKLLKLQVQMEEERMKLDTIRADAAARIAEIKCEILSDHDDPSQEVRRNVTLNPSATEFIPVQQSLPTHDIVPVSYTKSTAALAMEKESTRSYECTPDVSPSNMKDVLEVSRLMSQSIQLNRLPVPVPRVFEGDSLEFLEFKRSFQLLIENKGISAGEKLYYLKQYVSGKAKNAIDGCFLSSSEEAYITAWTTLEERVGHPFRIQRAFRNKLEKWSKI